MSATAPQFAGFVGTTATCHGLPIGRRTDIHTSLARFPNAAGGVGVNRHQVSHLATRRKLPPG